MAYFNELKILYGYDQAQYTVIYNNEEILVENKPVFNKEWYERGILSIQDLLDHEGQLLSYRQFISKYSCKTNFLQYYQIISAIPKLLLIKARTAEPIRKELYNDNVFTFHLNDSVQLHLDNIKTRDFYKLLLEKIHTVEHAGPKKWNRNLSLSEEKWEKIFTSLKKICKETKLKEFHFKLIHRIMVTKKELFGFGIKDDDNGIFILW